MKNLLKLIINLFLITTVVRAYDPDRQTSLLRFALWTAHISPEILNELKDFKNLIPTSVIDEIIAKHYLIDGNFRTALKYLRSQEFTQLQRQLVNMPEVVDVLEFLHVTTTNATVSHMSAIAAAELITTDGVKESSVQYDDDNVHNNAMTIVSKANSALNLDSIKRTKGTFNNEKMVHKRPHTHMQLYSIDDDTASSSNAQQPLVSIVLLENSVVKSNSYNDADAYNNKDRHHFNKQLEQQHSRKYRHRFSNNYHHHPYEYDDDDDDDHQQLSLRTFTSFVEEVLQHLPHAAYQNMIKDKCQKSTKFAQFYQALRSQEFKPLVEQSMQTDNIKKIIQTLNSHDVDVLALKPIAFQVISWGPNL